jgi:hypothetical protein
MTKRATVGICGLALLLFCGHLSSQVSTGTISGIVRDSTGAVVPNAKVVVLNEGTGIARTIDTDAEGRYSAPSLSLGNYRVTGTREGFQTEIRSGIVLTVGREAAVDLTLTVGSVTQALEVTGEAPLVETSSASLGSLVDDHTIRALPLNGRSYDQLALLQPGVTLTSPGQTSGAPFPAGTGKRFSVGGQRANSNNFLLDGTNINDHANGTPGGAAGTNLGVDTIQEFKIFTSAYKAEFGHSDGGVVTAITRSGTNDYHGTVFEYIRNSVLDARNFFDVGSSPPSFKRNQFGGVFGGPIKKDKLFFFAGYEGLRQGLGTTQIATVPTVLARQGILPTGTVKVNPTVLPILDFYPLPNGRDFGDGTAEFISSPTVVTNEDNVMARVDYQLNAKTGIFGRYSLDQDNLNAPLSLPTEVQTSSSRRQYSTIQANTVFGPATVNNFRFAYNRSRASFDQLAIPPADSDLSIIPGQALGTFQIGAVQTAGARTITPLGSTNGQGGYLWDFNIFEWGDDITRIVGKHTIKAGVDLQRMRDNTVNANQLNGAYTFTTFNTFLAGQSSNLQVGTPAGVPGYWGLRQTEAGVYIQDDYRVTSRLTLNLGFRWEAVTDPVSANGQMAILPSPSATSTVISDKFFSIGKKNFEPRFGLAWRLNESGKTVLRAGGGIYHNQILPWAYAVQLKIPPFFGVLNVTNPPFPNGYAALGGATQGLLTLNVMAPYQKTPVSDQYTVSIQQQLQKNLVLQVAYSGNRGNHLQTETEADSPIPTILPDGQAFYPAGDPRRNTAWAGIRLYQMDGNSVYNAGTISLQRQSASGFRGQIFYTYAKATDVATNVSGGDSVRSPNITLDPEDRNLDWGLSEFDIRNAVGYNFSYPLPVRVQSRFAGLFVNGWTLDGIGTFTSGQPFTARLSTAVSRNLSSVLAERPNLNPGFSLNPTSGTTVGCPGIPAGQPLGTADRYYDPCAFSLPAAGTYGDVGRDTIIGPGVEDVDFALEKVFKQTEKIRTTFRVETFNALNHTNLGLPNTSALTSAGAANPAAGRITYTTTSSRQIQFGLRINF